MLEFLFQLFEEIGRLVITSGFDEYTQICANSCGYHFLDGENL